MIKFPQAKYSGKSKKIERKLDVEDLVVVQWEEEQFMGKIIQKESKYIFFPLIVYRIWQTYTFYSFQHMRLY